MDIPVGAYREVFLDQAVPDHWKEINVDTGSTQSTLQDIKATELAGCYAYEPSDHPATSNRFIYWRTSQDCLELVELSFDSELIGNQLRYRFTNAPLLSGLTVHETAEHIIILVVTVSSVHRLTFKHPATNRLQNLYGGSAQSVFLYASATAAKDPNCFHVINRPHNAAMPTCGASCLSADGEVSVFAQSGTTDVVTIVQLSANGRHHETVLNEHASIMPKFITSLAQAIRGKRETVPTADLVLLNCEDSAVLVCLGADGNLRHAVAEIPAGGMHLHELVPLTGVGPGLQPHLARSCVAPDGEPLLAVHLSLPDSSAFHILRPRLDDDDGLSFEPCALVDTTHFSLAQLDLVDACLSSEGRLVGAWRGADGASFVASAQLAHAGWEAAIAQSVQDMPEERADFQDAALDPEVAYAEHIFAPGRFTVPVIARALNVFQRGGTVPSSMSLGTLSRAARLAVSAEVSRAEAADEEEASEVAAAAWASLRSCVLQWHLAGDGPSAIAPLPWGLLLVKKQRVSLLRPLDALETSTPRDSLLNVLRDLSALVPTAEWAAFDRHPAQSGAPHDVAEQLAQRLGDECDDDDNDRSPRLAGLAERAALLPDWPKPVTDMLLALAPGPPETTEPPAALASPLGAAVVAATLCQTIDNRLQLCRSLLVLSSAMKTETPAAALERYVSALDQVTQAFGALRWLCSRTAQRGTCTVAALVVDRYKTGERRGNDVFARARHMLGLLWPLNPSSRAMELLLASNEVNTLIALEKRLHPWCTDGVGLRLAHVARASLRLGRPGRAADAFVAAADHVAFEPGVLAAVGCAQTTPEKALGMYFIKAMDLLDRGEYREETGVVAAAALCKLPPDDAMLPTLHSRLFARALSLGRHADAFAAVRANPDPARRQDALRELAVTLIRAGQTNALLAFEFQDLLPALERVLERNARAACAALPSGYGALYSLHLRRGDRRKAAGYMYEIVFRLGREVSPSLQTLRTQHDCLLMCISALRLVPEKFRWIASQEYKEDVGRLSPNEASSEEDLETRPFLVTILQMSDLQRQLEMLKARITLCQARPSEYGQHFLDKKWTPTEMVAVLTACRYFCDALRLAALCGVSLARPLEGLASANVELQRQPDSDPWEWLQNNYTPETGDCEMTASNTAWRLLEVLLARHETPGLTTLHKAVTARFVAESFHPPQFVVGYYRRHNPAELLRIYLHAGWLEDAAQHAQKFVSAMSSSFPDFGGSENVTSGRPGCLPWRTLQQLLDELDRPDYQEIRTSLKDEVDRYIDMSQTAIPGVGLTAAGFAPILSQPPRTVVQW